jgi:hypothetical protein
MRDSSIDSLNSATSSSDSKPLLRKYRVQYLHSSASSSACAILEMNSSCERDKQTLRYAAPTAADARVS